MLTRLDKHAWLMGIAQAVARRSPCLSRQVGAIALDAQNHILSTGYNGPASGVEHCRVCHRKETGRDLYDCNAVHAEMNMLLQCPSNNLISTVYVTISPCLICMRLLANTSCELIVAGEKYSEESWELFYSFWIRRLHRRIILLSEVDDGKTA
jgi:dCMP deaminase